MRNPGLLRTFRTMFTVSLVLVALGSSLSVVRAAGRAVIYNFDGKAIVVRNHKTVLVDLDMALREGDLIRTEKDSFVDITLNSTVAVRLLASSESVVTNSDEGNMVLKTTGGNLLVNMKTLSTGSTFRLFTPSATVIVSNTLPGTQFLVRSGKNAAGKPSTTFISKKNTIYVRIETSSVTISILEGRALDVPLSDAIPPVRLATEEEDEAANQASSVYIAE